LIDARLRYKGEYECCPNTEPSAATGATAKADATLPIEPDTDAKDSATETDTVTECTGKSDA